MRTRDRPLVCHDCGRRPADSTARCRCGEPLWFEPAPVQLPTRSPTSMWEYAEALPVAEPTGLSAGVGGTSLIRTAPLDAMAGCHVFLKDERANPTGTFKDRGSAVGVLAADDRPVLTVSHGNMARSVAALAAANGIKAGILVPADVPAERLAPIARYDPAILRVDGEYDRLYHDALAMEDHLALNADVPLRIAGQKTLAFEIAAQAPAADAVVLPVSSGGNASAVWKGFRELVAAGAIESVPQLFLVQAATCAPIAAAFQSGRDTVEPVERETETIAYSIANADPPSGTRALRAARETGGAVISVSDSRIREAQERLATRAGVSAETASATVLAGLSRLAADGHVRAHDEVVAVITGTGLLEAPREPPTVPIVDRETVADTLRKRLGV